MIKGKHSPLSRSEHFFSACKTFFIPMLIVTLFISGCTERETETPSGTDRQIEASLKIEKVQTQLILMDTLVEITAYGPTPLTGKAIGEAITEMKRLERVFNRHESGTFAYILEHSPNLRSIKAPEEFITVLNESKRINRLSKGSFNPALAPVIDLWNFSDPSTFAVPSEQKIRELLPMCTLDHITISSEPASEVSSDTSETSQESSHEATWKNSEWTVHIHKNGFSMDCGGIGKGYIVDRAIEMLKHRGVSAALINGGGDLKTFGHKPGMLPFRIGIQSPDNKDSMAGILRIHDCAVATSGDYERSIELDGVRYHHILNPLTGMPSRLSRSCTVISSSALQADAWATALFIKGPERGIELAEKVQDIEVMIIGPDEKTYCSKGFQAFLEVTSD